MCTFKDWTLTFWVIGNYIGVASAAAAEVAAAAHTGTKAHIVGQNISWLNLNCIITIWKLFYVTLDHANSLW